MTAGLEGGEWSAARPGRTLPPGKNRYPFHRRLGGPQGRCGRAGKSRLHRDSIPDRPVRSQSLYLLSYRAHLFINKRKNVKWSRYRPAVAQRVGRCIALLFHDRGTRRGWVVSSTPRPHFTTGKDPVPILQEAGWAPGPVWTGGISRPHRDSIMDRPARSQSVYRLSYRAHICEHKEGNMPE